MALLLLAYITVVNCNKEAQSRTYQKLLVYNFCNFLGLGRTEWEEHPNTLDGAQMTTLADSHQKTGTKVTTPVAERASELHNPLSCHHRTSGKGTHIPVDDISKVEGRGGALIRPATSLQNMLDCLVSPEQQEETDLILCLNPGQLAIPGSQRLIRVCEQQNSMAIWDE